MFKNSGIIQFAGVRQKKKKSLPSLSLNTMAIFFLVAIEQLKKICYLHLAIFLIVTLNKTWLFPSETCALFHWFWRVCKFYLPWETITWP